MTTKFTFLLLPQIHLLDLAGPDQAIHEAMDYGADFEIEYCSLENNIVSTAGLPLGKVKSYKSCKLKKGDYLFIPGSNFTYLTSLPFKKQKDLLNWIVMQHANGVTLCSICAGAFVLAECGLLDGINCTTHFKKTKELQQLYPEAKVQENILFTHQNGIYTSAGIASGIDLTLHIIEQLKGSYFAHLVARELVVYKRRNGAASQESELLKFRNHIHAGIHKAQDFILKNIKKKFSIGELADVAGMSERNFTRVFKKETEITVNHFINLIRKEKISELMKNPDLSRIEIANKVGLSSDKQMMRIYKSK
ncbi:MAG: DJ-1/PfpI family protein [Bacteroidetes bacterium]|nr:DJ-1/PfpI family protein [Bacteroidota bacterium]